MRARELAQIAPIVSADEPAAAALRALTSSGMPGIVVRSDAGFAVIPASQVLRVVLPQYVLDDPSLGRVWDEASADSLVTRLADRRAGDLVKALDLSDDLPEPAVDGEATLVEVAAVMAAARVPLVAVLDDGNFIGVVIVNTLVEHLIG